MSFFSVFTAALRAWERMDLVVGINVISTGIQIGMTWAVVRIIPDLHTLVFALVVVQVWAALAAGWASWRYLPGFTLGRVFPFGQIFIILRKTWPLALLAALGVLYQRLGVLSLSVISSSAQTGWFSASGRLVEALKIGHVALLGAAFPTVSNINQFSQRAEEAKQMLKTIFWVLLAITCLEIAGTIAISPWLVQALFGQGFLPAAGLLKIMVWQLLPYTITAVLSLRLIIYRRERALLVSTAVSALASLGIYFWLVPQNGASGASLAAVLGEGLTAVILIALR
jgi:O-antigen/teichoic acid export membrane protein